MKPMSHARTMFATLMLSLFALLPLAYASETDAQRVSFNVATAQLKEVGRGEMRWMWFELYRARLLTLSGQYSAAERTLYPQMLDIEYYRQIDSKDLVEATLEQWQHLGFGEQEIKQWQDALVSAWPNVNSGDRLSFLVKNDDVGEFFYNDKSIGEISVTGFAQAFLAIWLSENTSRPDLRAQLLGEKACDC